MWLIERYARKSICHGCMVWIEKSVTRDHCLASLGDPRERFFYPHHTPMKDTYILIWAETLSYMCKGGRKKFLIWAETLSYICNGGRKLFVWENLKILIQELQFVMSLKSFAKHDMRCLPCSYVNDVVNMLSLQLWRHWCLCDVTEISFCQCSKHTSLSFHSCCGNRLCGVISLIIREEHGIQFMPCSSPIMSDAAWNTYNGEVQFFSGLEFIPI